MRERITTTITAVILILLAGSALQAAPVDNGTARQVALAKLQTLPGSTGFSLSEVVPSDPAVPLFYICRTTPRGYLVISGDDGLPPVMAFSLENSCGDLDINRNPLLSLLTADLRSRLAQIDLLPNAQRREQERQWRDLLAGATAP